MYIITGATGFIGSNLLAEMESRGYEELVAVDTFGEEAKWKNVAKRGAIRYVPPRNLMEFVHDHVGKIEGILHLGAISSTTETDVDFIAENNFGLTVELYEFCQKTGVRMVYASSAATYGDGEMGFKDCDDLAFIKQLSPLNPYGWSKNAVDKFIAADSRFGEGGTGVVGLKFFNVYGPNEYHKGMQMSVMRHFYEQIRTKGKVRLFKSYRDECGDGEQKRDFVWVGDCVDVMLWMLEHKDVRGLYNVGTGCATSYNMVAKCVAKAMGVDPVIEYIDMPDSVKRQYQYFTEADLSKLRVAGYAGLMTNVEDGVRQYVCEYLMKEDCYR